MRWALLLALLATSALAQRPDRLSVSPRLDRRDRLGASGAASPILLSLSLLPPDSECSGTPPDGVTFTRASGATCINTAGVAFNLTSNQARVTSKGLLVEGAATNEMLRSRATSTVPWSCPTCGATTLGMDGATSVPTIGVGTASQAITPAAGARIVSVYVRNAGGLGCSVTLSADAETTGAVSVPNLGNWQRLSLAYTSDAAVTVALAVSGGSCTAIAADYWQDEAGAIATSPVVSSGTAATRAGERALVSTSGLSETRGCAGVSLSPNWSSAPPAVSMPVGFYAISGTENLGNNRLIYANPGATTVAAYGGSGPTTVETAASYTEGVAERYLSEWDAAVPRQTICSEMGCATGAGPFTAYPAFGDTLYLGSRGVTVANVYGHLSNLVLGRTAEACQ